MDRAAGDALIHRYRHHQRWFPNTDPKDRHVAAAALSARKLSGASNVTIMTWNVKHFNQKELSALGLCVENPDAFLCGLLADSPEGVTAAFIRMRDNLRNPPKSSRECAETLAAQRFDAVRSGNIGSRLSLSMVEVLQYITVNDGQVLPR
jgi:hypothetical protein